MSRINIYETSVADGEDVVAVRLDVEPEHSLREGEELMAASTIIDLLDALGNGEALVITREIW